MGAGVALAFALAHPERVNGLILVRPAWLDRPFPTNLRWFPLVASLLQEYPADEAAHRCEQSPAFSELAAESKPAAESLLGQFRRPHARERAANPCPDAGECPCDKLDSVPAIADSYVSRR
jgi:pimeloyl-ACP methyl ester carboxylesterase